MRSRLLLLLAAVTLALGGTDLASASWTAGGTGTTSARAAVLAPPTGLTVTGQSCTPTFSGAPAIAYRDGVTANGTSSVVVPRPAGTVSGDFLLAAYSIRDHLGTITAPAGWTQLRLDVYAGKNISTGIWYRTATASDPASWTWTTTATALNAVVALAAYSGVGSVNAHGASTQTSLEVIAPSITTTANASLLVGVFTTHNMVALSVPEGMTNRLSYATPNINGGGQHQMTIHLDEEVDYNAGATGSRTATSATSSDNIGALLALAPSVAPTPSTISYRTGTTAAGTTSLTLTLPSGVAVGDLLLVGYAKRKNNVTITPPAGWTQLRLDAWSASEYQQGVYWRVATSADVTGTTYTWGSSDTTASAAALMVYRGVDQAQPIQASAAVVNAQDATVVAPSITPTRADTRLVALLGGSDGRTFVTLPTGPTWRQTATTGGGGAEVTLGALDQPWPAAGAPSGTRTATFSGNSRAIGQHIALKAESYPLAALSWTATTSSYAESYRLGRSVGATETVATTISPVATTTYTAGWTNRLAAGTTYTMRLRTRISSWISAGDTSVSFTAISTC